MFADRPDVAARLSALGGKVFRHNVMEDAWWNFADDCDCAVFATPLPLTLAALDRAAHFGASAPRLVAFSSNNVAVHPLSGAYRVLANAEAALQRHEPGVAIIRPTLIYGDPRLVTMSRVMRMARRWPVVPVPGSGRALVQPVFHEDLGRLAAGLAALEPGGVYAAGGPEIVTMRDMFKAAVHAAGGRALMVPAPRWALSLVAAQLETRGLFSREQIARTNEDRVAVAQTPLPEYLAPRVGLREGLAHLARVLSAAGE